MALRHFTFCSPANSKTKTQKQKPIPIDYRFAYPVTSNSLASWPSSSRLGRREACFRKTKGLLFATRRKAFLLHRKWKLMRPLAQCIRAHTLLGLYPLGASGYPTQQPAPTVVMVTPQTFRMEMGGSAPIRLICIWSFNTFQRN